MRRLAGALSHSRLHHLPGCWCSYLPSFKAAEQSRERERLVNLNCFPERQPIGVKQLHSRSPRSGLYPLWRVSGARQRMGRLLASGSQTASQHSSSVCRWLHSPFCHSSLRTATTLELKRPLIARAAWLPSLYAWLALYHSPAWLSVRFAPWRAIG